MIDETTKNLLASQTWSHLQLEHAWTRPDIVNSVTISCEVRNESSTSHKFRISVDESKKHNDYFIVFGCPSDPTGLTKKPCISGFGFDLHAFNENIDSRKLWARYIGSDHLKPYCSGEDAIEIVFTYHTHATQLCRFISFGSDQTNPFRLVVAGGDFLWERTGTPQVNPKSAPPRAL